MGTIVCPGCNLSVTPIRVMEKAPNTKQWWRITKCPRERCKRNIDVEKYDKFKHNSRPDEDDEGRSFWRDEV